MAKASVQDLYGTQGSSMYDNQEAQAEEKEKFQVIQKEQQGAKCLNWEEIQKNCHEQKKKENRKRASAFSGIACKKSISSMIESGESGEI